MKRNDKVEVLVFVDPALGIKLGQVLEVISAVKKFNHDELPLHRLTLTSTRSTTTAWQELLPFLDAPVVQKQRECLRIFDNLLGLSKNLALELKQRGIKMFGEWHAADLSEQSLCSMRNQGYDPTETQAMLTGIHVALNNDILQGLEFQITNANIDEAAVFLEFCRQLNIEGHLEVKEVSFQSGVALPRYIPLQADKVRELVCHPLIKALGSNPVPPFFCPGLSDPRGSCPYFYRGLFLWPDGNGGLYQTVCLSDQTIVGPTPFVPASNRIAESMKLLAPQRNVRRDQMNGHCRDCEQWQNCLGGCRAMAYLASEGDYFAPDPNCWKIRR